MNGTKLSGGGSAGARDPEVAEPTFLSTNEMALFSAISFVDGGYMKKKRVKCPVCGVYFDPRIPYQHINAHHAHASDHELSLIRDARRHCFGNAKPIKQKAVFLLVPSSGTSGIRARG
jgi:hypothetical protein